MPLSRWLGVTRPSNEIRPFRLLLKRGIAAWNEKTPRRAALNWDFPLHVAATLAQAEVPRDGQENSAWKETLVAPNSHLFPGRHFSFQKAVPVRTVAILPLNAIKLQ
jgi:hypothetical protein